MFDINKDLLALAFKLGVATPAMKAMHYSSLLENEDERYLATKELSKLFASDNESIKHLARQGLIKALTIDPEDPERTAISTLFGDTDTESHKAVSAILDSKENRYECLLAMLDIDTTGDEADQKFTRARAIDFLESAHAEENDAEWKDIIESFQGQIERGERMSLKEQVVFVATMEATA